jgi:GcrA cell cycle regulator
MKTDQNQASPNFSWTDECVAVLRQLWKEGQSGTQIANQLGGDVTRNAVIGKVHRLGLAARSPAPLRNPKAAPVAIGIFPRHDNAKARSRKFATAPLRVNTAVRRWLPPLGEEPAEVVKLADLTARTCRWPVGDPLEPDFHFCGRTRHSALTSYCPHHAALATRPAR